MILLLTSQFVARNIMLKLSTYIPLTLYPQSIVKLTYIRTFFQPFCILKCKERARCDKPFFTALPPPIPVVISASEITLSRWSRLHLQSLAPAPVLWRVDVRQATGRKHNCRIFITTWWKTYCTDPTYGIRVGRRRNSYEYVSIPKLNKVFWFRFWRGSRGISDIPPRGLRFTKIA
jgi:hypothetical protein